MLPPGLATTLSPALTALVTPLPGWDRDNLLSPCSGELRAAFVAHLVPVKVGRDPVPAALGSLWDLETGKTQVGMGPGQSAPGDPA